MASLYDGEHDARQTDAETMPRAHSLFRKRYRKLTDAEVALQDAIKDKADELAKLIGALNPTVAARLGVNPDYVINNPQWESDGFPERDAANITLAIRHIEDAVYRAVKALTA
jgi:hypothetical protein